MIKSLVNHVSSTSGKNSTIWRKRGNLTGLICTYKRLCAFQIQIFFVMYQINKLITTNISLTWGSSSASSTRSGSPRSPNIEPIKALGWLPGPRPYAVGKKISVLVSSLRHHEKFLNLKCTYISWYVIIRFASGCNLILQLWQVVISAYKRI